MQGTWVFLDTNTASEPPPTASSSRRVMGGTASTSTPGTSGSRPSRSCADGKICDPFDRLGRPHGPSRHRIIDIPDQPASTFAARLAEQTALLEAGEALIQITTDAGWVEGTADDQTYDFTVNTTLTPPVSLQAVTVDRYSLEQRQATYRIRKQTLISEAAEYLAQDLQFGDARLDDWVTYRQALRALSDTPANPESVVFPARPSTTEDDSIPSWTKLYRRGNVIGTVSKGLLNNPTGALVEHGVVATGRYWKWTDGILLMSHRMQLTYSSGVQLSGTWSFPHDFGIPATPTAACRPRSRTRTTRTPHRLARSPTRRSRAGELFLNTFAQTGVSLIFRNDAAPSSAARRPGSSASPWAAGTTEKDT